MAVLAEVPRTTYVYRARRRGARPALLFKTFADLLKAWSGGAVTLEQFEQQSEILVDSKAGRPILRADDDVPDAEIPAGALWRWLAPPSGDGDGTFEIDVAVPLLPVGDCPTDSTRGWHRGPHCTEEIEHPGARGLPVRHFADPGQVVAASGGKNIGYWDVWKLRASMPGALAGERGPEGKAAAERVLALVGECKSTLDEALIDLRGGVNAQWVRDIVSICGRPPEQMPRHAEDMWLWGYGYAREPDVAYQDDKGDWKLSGLAARATDGLIVALEAGDDDKLVAVLQLFEPRFGPPDDLPEEWTRGQAKLPEADVFGRGASTCAYAGAKQMDGGSGSYGNSVRVGVDYDELGQSFLSPSAHNMSAIGVAMQKSGTGGGGDLIVELYTWTGTWGAGSKLATYRIATSDVYSASIVWLLLGGEVAALANGSTYWLRVYTDGSPDVSNHVLVRVSSSSQYAGGNLGTKTGAAWTDEPAKDLSLVTYDNTDGGVLVARCSEASSVTESTTKGAALHSTDIVYSVSGATYTFDQNSACLKVSVGEEVAGWSTGTVQATESNCRYGHVTVSAGVTVTFTGNATATNSGLRSNPTSADTSSKDSTLTLNGTSASPNVFTNSVGAYNASNRWMIYWRYGVIGAWGVVTLQYPSPANLGTVVELPVGWAVSTASVHTIGTTNLVSGGQPSSTIYIFGSSTSSWTMPANLGRGTVDASGGSAVWNCVLYNISYTNGTTQAQIDWAGWYVLGGADKIRFYLPLIMISAGATLYTRSGAMGPTDIRPTTVVPTGLTLVDMADGTAKATIDNIASYANTDLLVFCDFADDTIILAIDKASYVAVGAPAAPGGGGGAAKPANCAILPMSVGGHDVYCEATSDFYVFSPASELGHVSVTYTPSEAQVEEGVGFGTGGTAYTGTLVAGAPGAAFDVRLAATVGAVNSPVAVTGGITLTSTSEAVAVALSVYRASDDELIEDLVAEIVDFEAGVQKTWAEIAGAAVAFTPDTAQEVYLVAQVADGTPTVTSETSQRFGFVARPGKPSFASDPTPGDGTLTLHCTAVQETDVLYARWRTSGGGWTALSESFKRTGSGALVLTGRTNDARHEVELVPYAGGTYGLPSDPCFGTPTDGSTAPSGQLSLPVDYLRKTVAASGAFQAWVGADNEVEALDYVLPVTAARARGAPAVSSGALASASVAYGGRGYRAAPAVEVDGDGTGAIVTAAVSGGKVTGFTVTNGGSGYTAEKTEIRVAKPGLPLAIVDWMPGRSKRAVATGTRTHFDGAGELLLLFRGPVDSEHDEEEAAYAFQNKIGAIIAEIEQLAGRAGYLDIRELRQISGPQRPGEDELQSDGDYYQAIYAVSWEGL